MLLNAIIHVIKVMSIAVKVCRYKGAKEKSSFMMVWRCLTKHSCWNPATSSNKPQLFLLGIPYMPSFTLGYVAPASLKSSTKKTECALEYWSMSTKTIVYILFSLWKYYYIFTSVSDFINPNMYVCYFLM